MMARRSHDQLVSEQVWGRVVGHNSRLPNSNRDTDRHSARHVGTLVVVSGAYVSSLAGGKMSAHPDRHVIATDRKLISKTAQLLREVRKGRGHVSRKSLVTLRGMVRP